MIDIGDSRWNYDWSKLPLITYLLSIIYFLGIIMIHISNRRWHYYLSKLPFNHSVTNNRVCSWYHLLYILVIVLGTMI